MWGMNFKKRLLLVCIAVIVITPYFYHYIRSPVTGPGPPSVDGWNQNTSKDVRDYINERVEPLILPKSFCTKKGLLLVMVNVRLNNFEARDAIRATWGRKRDNVTFYFLVGKERIYNNETIIKLNHESQKHDDIIQEDFIDTYNNLTLKSVNMLKLFNRHCYKSHKYLMKIDDDVFLNVENVLTMLANRERPTDVLVGKIINSTKPFRDPTSKWYVPYELYPEEYYPPYLCGPSYIMSADVAKKLYHCTLQTPIFFIEDVYVTGICARKVNVTPRHNPLFTCTAQKKYICVHRQIITLHYYKPDEMRKSYQVLQENECPPQGSLMEFIWSLISS